MLLLSQDLEEVRHHLVKKLQERKTPQNLVRKELQQLQIYPFEEGHLQTAKKKKKNMKKKKKNTKKKKKNTKMHHIQQGPIYHMPAQNTQQAQPKTAKKKKKEKKLHHIQQGPIYHMTAQPKTAKKKKKEKKMHHIQQGPIYHMTAQNTQPKIHQWTLMSPLMTQIAPKKNQRQ